MRVSTEAVQTQSREIVLGADVPVLHNDEDFDVLARHTDLKIAT